jgi:hypothetical protein
VFATYLGSVEMLGADIEKQYPGQGVTVLKGGDHGAKTAAEKRFKAPDGPRVLICTAAGREGINLQMMTFGTEDQKEAARAFVEKRKPNYVGN